MSDDPTDRSLPAMTRLLALMRRLRDPERGCPWDIEQTYATIAPYTLEEAYEVADVIEREAWTELPDELGDLLLQVVYYSQMGAEEGRFTFEDVANAVTDKMIRRHPHLFGEVDLAAAGGERALWEQLKAAERQRNRTDDVSVLANVPIGLPALSRAQKLQNRAARISFDWPSAAPVLDKIREELAEVEATIEDRESLARRQEEIGDLLFVVANLARHLQVDPETALRAANAKFERRFRAVERKAAMLGDEPARLGLAVLDGLWEEVKREEAASPDREA